MARLDRYGYAHSLACNRRKILSRLAADDRDNFFKQLFVKSYAKHKTFMFTPMWWDSLRKCFQHEMDRINILAITTLNRYKEAPIDLTGVKGGKSIEGKMRTYLSGFWMSLENALRDHREKTMKRFKRNINMSLISSQTLRSAENDQKPKTKAWPGKGKKKAETVPNGENRGDTTSADGHLSKNKSRSFFSTLFKTKRQTMPSEPSPSTVVISMPTVVQHANIELDKTGAVLIVNGSNGALHTAPKSADSDAGSENKAKHSQGKETERGRNFKTLSLRRSTGSITRTTFIKPVVKDAEPLDFRPFSYGKSKRSGELVTATSGFVSIKGKAECATEPTLNELPQLAFFSTNFGSSEYVTYFTTDTSGRPVCFSMRIISKKEADELETTFGVQKQVLSTVRTGSSLHDVIGEDKCRKKPNETTSAAGGSSPLAETNDKEPSKENSSEYGHGKQKEKEAAKEAKGDDGEKKEQKENKSLSPIETETQVQSEAQQNSTPEESSKQEPHHHECKKRKTSHGEHERSATGANGEQTSIDTAETTETRNNTNWEYKKRGRYATMRNYFGTHRWSSLPNDKLERGENAPDEKGSTETIFLVAARAASGNSFAVVTYSAKSPMRLASRTVASAVCTLLNFAKDKCKKAAATPELHRGLTDYDFTQLNSRLKFGVMYRKTGQLEDEVFGNKSAPRDFYDFMDAIGERVEIAGYNGFLGGLCARKDDVRWTYANRYRGYEVVFHVAPLLHYDEGEKLQLQRKRHIGNDICTIVYNAGRDPLPTSFIRSDFLNVFIVVSPVFAEEVITEASGNEGQKDSPKKNPKKKSNNDSSSSSDDEQKGDSDDTSTKEGTEDSSKHGKERAHERKKKKVVGYRIDSAARECTPSFGPPLPKLSCFIPIEHKHELKEIILTKRIIFPLTPPFPFPFPLHFIHFPTHTVFIFNSPFEDSYLFLFYFPLTPLLTTNSRLSFRNFDTLQISQS